MFIERSDYCVVTNETEKQALIFSYFDGRVKVHGVHRSTIFFIDNDGYPLDGYYSIDTMIKYLVKNSETKTPDESDGNSGIIVHLMEYINNDMPTKAYSMLFNPEDIQKAISQCFTEAIA